MYSNEISRNMRTVHAAPARNMLLFSFFGCVCAHPRSLRNNAILGLHLPLMFDPSCSRLAFFHCTGRGKAMPGVPHANLLALASAAVVFVVGGMYAARAQDQTSLIPFCMSV